MKYLYFVSDSYVKAIDKEVEDYSFDCKIYPSIKTARKFLIASNISEVLAFVFLLDKVSNTDYNDLLDLLEKIDEISPKDKLVIISINDETIYDDMVNECVFKNIRLFTVNYPEVVTDSFIKRDLVGTVLINLFDPYIEKKPNKLKTSNDYKNKIVTYEPIIDSRIFWLLEPIEPTLELRRCINNDEVLKRCEDKDQILYFLRIQQIYNEFNEEFSSEEMLENLLKDDNYSDFNKIVYRVIFKLIKDNKL